MIKTIHSDVSSKLASALIKNDPVKISSIPKTFKPLSTVVLLLEQKF